MPAVAKREVVNYFASLRFVEKKAARKNIAREDILRLHKIMADDVMDHGMAGRYRTIHMRVGRHVPPPPEDVSGLMFVADPGARLDAGAETFRSTEPGEARSASEAGAAFTIAARPQEYGSA